jgi:hypothetical protein
MGPLARFFNVFFSPGAVFDDIRSNPRGWLLPIIVCAAAAGIFAALYFARYDMAAVYKEYLRGSWGIKLAGMMGGPEARDKALAAAVDNVAAMPLWQLQASAIVNALTGFTLIVWFFTFLYGLIALVAGWLPSGVKGSKLFINLGIVVGILIGFVAIQGALQVVTRLGAKSLGAGASPQAPPDWVAAVGVVLGLVVVGLVVWSMMRLGRELAYGRIIGAVSYGLAPAALAGVLGILIVLVRTPDATWIEDIVPANLTLLLNLKQGNAVLASLGSSLGLFSIWSLVLTIIGLSKALGRTTREASAVVLAPWGVWVLLKLLFAAIS